MIAELGWVLLGNKVHVTDPCHKPGTWCAAWDVPVKPGIYECSADIVDLPDWGTRVASLQVLHREHEPATDLVCEAYDIQIGVDSGQCGIFNLSSYRKLNDMDTPDGYSAVCYATAEHYAAVLDNHGAVVSSTGYGDGGYTLYTYTDSNDDVVGLEILYLYEDYDDEV